MTETELRLQCIHLASRTTPDPVQGPRPTNSERANVILGFVAGNAGKDGGTPDPTLNLSALTMAVNRPEKLKMSRILEIAAEYVSYASNPPQRAEAKKEKPVRKKKASAK